MERNRDRTNGRRTAGVVVGVGAVLMLVVAPAVMAHQLATDQPRFNVQLDDLGTLRDDWVGDENAQGQNEDQATEAPEATEVPDATETPEATDAPEATDPPEATDAPEATEAPEATDGEHSDGGGSGEHD